MKLIMPEKKEWKKYLLVLGTFVVLSTALFCADNMRTLPQNQKGESLVKRGKIGEGEKTEEYQVKIGDLPEEKVTVEIGEKAYTDKELKQVFHEAGEELEELVLGDNASLDEVRSDLDLMTELPDQGISIAWELDNYEVINVRGELQEENLTDTGTLVELCATMTCQDQSAQHVFSACLYPPSLTYAEELKAKLLEKVSQKDEKSKTKDYLPLPSHVDGETVLWRYVKDFRALGILALGVVAVMLLYLSEQQKGKEQRKEQEKQMELEYPQMLNRFVLYLGAGMTARKTWFRIVEEYQDQTDRQKENYLYEQMAYTMHEIQSGNPEAACYEAFGERCQTTRYRKFGTMLSQNLKKGNKGLAILLKQEAVQAFEERRNLAKRLGEEAGTKMLIPMFLMLGVVLIILVVPAFLSIQI